MSRPSNKQKLAIATDSPLLISGKKRKNDNFINTFSKNVYTESMVDSSKHQSHNLSNSNFNLKVSENATNQTNMKSVNRKETILNEEKKVSPGFKSRSKKGSNLDNSIKVNEVISPVTSPKLSRNPLDKIKASFSNSEQRSKFINKNKNQPSQRAQIMQPSDKISFIKSELKSLEKGERDSNENTFQQLLEDFKLLMEKGIKTPKYFLKSEVLISEEDPKSKLDKILKINSFCEEIEMMEVKLSMLKKEIQPNKLEINEVKGGVIFLQNESTEFKSKDSLPSPDQEILLNFLQVGSERRISVYKDLFINLKRAFDDIIEIVSLNEYSETIIKEELENLSVCSDEASKAIMNMYVDIKTLGNFNSKLDKKNVLFSDKGSDESNNHSVNENVSLRESYISNEKSEMNSEGNLDEGVEEEDIKLPDSKIKNVMIEDNIRSPFGRQRTKKDVLLYDHYGSMDENKLQFYSQLSTRNKIESAGNEEEESTLSQIKFQPRPTITELPQTKTDINLFIKARRELGYRSASQLY